MLDGYSVPDAERVHDDRVRYFEEPETLYSKKRQNVNKAIREYSNGEFVCWMDGHCSVDHAWDAKILEVLKNDPKMVIVPQRRRLDPFDWCEQVQDHRKPHVDFEHFLWHGLRDNHSLHGFRWDQLSIDRKDEMVSDIMTSQGSMFIMSKEWYLKCGFFTDLGYQGWGQEAESVVMGSLWNGGRSCVAKNTFYTHWHKGKSGRGYHLPKTELLKSYAYSFNKWCIERKEFFINHMNNFPRQPKWPDSWIEELYNKK